MGTTTFTGWKTISLSRRNKTSSERSLTFLGLWRSGFPNALLDPSAFDRHQALSQQTEA
ncbi:hypothetical protein C8J35_10220 [Rhizobium sp. PP-F2F-G38]|nr:hypothetical protein C8J37_10221 [Rhizobium sp. PP-WC-1G-195]PYE99135.1 hypothetical protein C8J35_10220 [Rhizobium sp. PP-F2F-G38]